MAARTGNCWEAAAGLGPMAAWLLFKHRVRQIARIHTRLRQNDADQRRRYLSNAVESATTAHAAAVLSAATPAQTDEAARRVREAAGRLRDLDSAASCSASAATDAAWHLYGEGPTRWFHRLGERHDVIQPMSTITNTATGETLSADSLADAYAGADLAADYFDADAPEGLFKQPQTAAAAQTTMLNHIDKQLSTSDAAAAEGPSADGGITEAELLTALRSFKPGTAPGHDGIPYEFYTTFWPVVAVPLVAAVNEAYTRSPDDPSFPDEFTLGTIALIFKGTASRPLPADQVSSYRPITLLNADYKTLAKAVTNRLSPVIHTVIDATQTAFVPGRWIGDNILCHLETFDAIPNPDDTTADHAGPSTSTRQAQRDLAACLLFLDFEKAYDKVCRSWIFACLERMGVGPGARKWIKHLMADTRATVGFGGVQSRAFAVRAGAAQGSPLSPLLYVIAAQPLAAALRHLQADGSIGTVQLPARPRLPPSHQHADDISIHTDSVASAKVAIGRAITPFCQASGSELNLSKSVGLQLGARAPLRGLEPTTGITFIAPTDTVKHLGILLTAGDRTAAAAQSWQRLVVAVAARVRHWSARDLTLLGRVYVAKQLMASTITHLASFIPPPPTQLKALQHLMDGFMLSHTSPRPSDDRPLRARPAAAIRALPRAEGGLAAPDIDLQATALRAKTAARLLHPQQRPWKTLALAHFLPAFPKMGAGAMLSTVKPSSVRGLPPRWVSHWRALRATRPHRLAQPGAMLAQQVFIEPLAGNRRVGPRSNSSFAVSLGVASATWGADKLQVGDLRPAAGGALPAAMPPEWADRLRAGAPTPTSWSVSDDGRWVRHTSPTGDRLFSVGEDGRLLDPSSPAQPTPSPPAVTQWHDACIIASPPSKGIPLGADMPLPPIRPPDASAPPTQPPLRQQELFLGGKWSEVAFDPMLWGLGQEPITFFKVKHATLRLTRLRAIDLHPAQYAPAQAVLPPIWGTSTTGAADPQAVQTLAARQQATYTAKTALASAAATGRGRPRPSDADLAALYHQPWMQPSLPRQLPADRAALRRDAAVVSPYATDDCRDPLAVPTAARPAWREAWAQVHAADRHRPHRVFTWLLMHAALRCGAAKVQFWPVGAEGLAETACCSHSACRPRPALNPPAAGQLETLHHALIECPAVKPALRWVGRLWVRIDGGSPPHLTPSVWIQGSCATWQPQASQRAALWHTLRIAALAAVWGLRDRRVAWAEQFAPADVAESFVRDIRRIIRTDWARASADAMRIPGVRSSWFPAAAGRQAAGFDVSAFDARWCVNDVLASVGHPPGGQPTVRLRLLAPTPSDLA